jgi:1,4-dihydroxy-6-naphthoate synthase
MKPLRIGISPCPNDTFAFHGLLEGEVDAEGLDLEIELADVEELNRRFARGDLDAAKCSFHAALRLAATSVVLPAGAALGFGVGPVLLAREPGHSIVHGSRVLCPGEWTTAHLLYRLFHPGEGKVEQVPFSQILPRLELGQADFGVCIHEARFTYAGRGLALVEDLGETWEARTRCPLLSAGSWRAATSGATRWRASRARSGARSRPPAHGPRRRCRRCGATPRRWTTASCGGTSSCT